MLDALDMRFWRKTQRISCTERNTNEENVLKTIEEKQTLIDILT